MIDLKKLLRDIVLAWLFLLAPNLLAVKIGAILPLSGEYGLEGRCVRQCIEIAIEDASRSGIIDISLISYDDSSAVTGAIKSIEKLAADEEVIAVIGPCNDWCSQAALPLFNKHTLVGISPSSISSLLSEETNYFFRVCPTDEYQGRLLADHALSKGRNIATVYENNLHSQGLKFFFNAQVKSNGANLLASIPYDRGTDLSLLTEADVVFIACGPNTAIDVCDGLIREGNPYKLGCDAMTTQRFKRWAISNASRLEHFTYVDTSRQELMSFIERYEDRYGNTPSDWGILSYDATNIIISSLQYARDRQAIRDYLMNLGRDRDPFGGITGSITFNSRGDVVRNHSIGMIVEERALVSRSISLAPDIEKPQLPIPEVVEEIKPEEPPAGETPEFIPYDEPPRIKKMTYPLYLQQRQIECSGILSLTIDTSGGIIGSKLLRFDAPDWVGEKVVEESLKWEFYPARQRDKPVEVTIAFPFKFQIK